MNAKSTIRVCDMDVQITGSWLKLARLDGDKFTFPKDPEGLVSSLRKCPPRVDLLTFMQGLSDKSPDLGYPVEMDNLAVVHVSTFDHWWSKQLRSLGRNRARQAENKGVTFREMAFDETLLAGICKIYNETPVRQGRPFRHYGITLERAREYAGTFLERSVFIGAFLGDIMIGFIKLVSDESRTQADLVHILSLMEHKDKAPTNALIAQAVRYCAEHGISYLTYDNFSYGNKQEDSLSEFKERNGFQKVNVPRYYVPLTVLGRSALRLGLHHDRPVDYLPQPVIRRLRELRNSWYQRKVARVTEA